MARVTLRGFLICRSLEEADRVSAMLLRPTATSRADARSLLRVEAQGLLARINASAKRPGLSAEARAEFQRVLASAPPDSVEARQARIQWSLPAGSASTPSGVEKTVEERQHDEADDRLASDQ